MKEIPLTQGKIALVDDKDFKKILGHTWFAVQKGRTGDNWYAATQIAKPYPGRRQKTLYMHHLILPPRFGFLTDHRDRNGLNNQRRNLRYCTRMQNRINCRKNINASSHFRGVSWHKLNRKWVSVIRHEGHLYHLGFFDSEIEAAKTYDRKALELRGSIEAKINFPKG